MREKEKSTTWRFRVLAIVLLMFALGLLAQSLRDVRFRDSDRVAYVLFRTEKEAEAERDLPGIQLVGSVNATRHFGVFRRKSVDAVSFPRGVIYEDGTYYLVGEPRDFLCSLLDKEKHPRLARPPAARQPLKATTDKEAIGEVEEILKRQLDEE